MLSQTTAVLVVVISIGLPLAVQRQGRPVSYGKILAKKGNTNVERAGICSALA